MKKGTSSSQTIASLLGRKVIAAMNCSTDNAYTTDNRSQAAKVIRMNISGVTTISSVMVA